MRSVAKVLKRKLYNTHVKWPSEDEQEKLATIFRIMRAIPNVIGCIDGTHIPVKCNRSVHSSYLNRKEWTSVNVLAICDERLRFTYICYGAPGCVHDARVWQNCSLYNDFMQGKRRKSGHFLLGDAAYGNTSVCLCPYASDADPYLTLIIAIVQYVCV